MAKKLTKTQIKRLYRDILSKSRKLWQGWAAGYGRDELMTTPDYIAIEKIIKKYQKRMR